MAGTGENRLARQLGAVHEEQQGDGQGRGPAEDHRALAFAGQEGGDGDDHQQGEGEVIEQQAQMGHGEKSL